MTTSGLSRLQKCRLSRPFCAGAGWSLVLAAGMTLVSAPVVSAAAREAPEGGITAPRFAPQDPASSQSNATTEKKPKDDKPQKEENPPKEKKKKGAVQFLFVPHPSLRVGKQVQVDFRARVRGEANRSDAASADQSRLDLERRRVGIEGELLKAVAFQVSRETTGTDPWREAWVDYEQFTFARAQWGLFKLPFSVDENTGATNQDFASRSLAANALAPGRARGWMLHGQVFNHALGYEYGVFDHDGHNAYTNNPGRVTGASTTAWRLTSQPLRRIKSKWTDLEVGYGSTTSDLVEGFSSIKGQTVLGEDFYASHFLVNGARRRTSYELRFRPGPFSLKSEFIRVTEERLGEGVEDTALSPLVAEGWYMSGTWAVTGETKSDGLTEPIRPLARGGIGALEVAVRLEQLSFGSEASFAAPGETGSTSPRADVVLGNSDRALTLGVNWYPNRYLKLQFNVIKEQLTDPSQGPLPGTSSFWSRVIRLQLGF